MIELARHDPTNLDPSPMTVSWAFGGTAGHLIGQIPRVGRSNSCPRGLHIGDAGVRSDRTVPQ